MIQATYFFKQRDFLQVQVSDEANDDSRVKDAPTKSSFSYNNMKIDNRMQNGVVRGRHVH